MPDAIPNESNDSNDSNAPNNSKERDRPDFSSAAAGAAIAVAAGLLQNIRPLTPAHAKGDSALWDTARQRALSVARLAREILEAMHAPQVPSPGGPSVLSAASGTLGSATGEPERSSPMTGEEHD